MEQAGGNERDDVPTSSDAPDVNETPGWYGAMRGARSRGQSTRKATSLADLHRARREHAGQFFTPDAVARWMWSILEGPMRAVEAASQDDAPRFSILDNSIGSGRLIQFASPSRHWIGGVDTDAELVDALAATLTAAGFEHDLCAASMAEVNPRRYHAAIINPPFSVHLDSPTLEPYSCTTWGEFGPHTAAVSHAYALHQALDAASIVVALLPATYADSLLTNDEPEMQARLRALYRLPPRAFEAEGASVDTTIAVFGRPAPTFTIVEGTCDPDRPCSDDLALDFAKQDKSWPMAMSATTRAASEPSIPGPVTGDRVVRIVKSGRRLRLKFRCAFVHAKIANAILGERVVSSEGHRYPAGIKFTGQGKLDLDVLLAQADPLAAWTSVLTFIRQQGTDPQPDPAIEGFLRRRVRRNVRERTPFGHWVDGGIRAVKRTIVAKRKRLLSPMTWGSPVIRVGDALLARPHPDGGYLIEKDGASTRIQEDELRRDFDLGEATPAGWREEFPDRSTVFPELAHAIRARAIATGAAEIASWDYQLQDLIELRMSRGAVSAWSMGCGKTRLAIALCLMGGRCNGIVVEPHLLGEFVDQLRETGIPESDWQVITRPEHCRELRRINLISIARLRAPVATGAGRRTYASRLRRRFSTLCVDEAHLLRHHDTDQTRAVHHLSPRRRYGMTGTPIANYVNDLLPLLAWAGGDGTVLQPYGRHRPLLLQRAFASMTLVPRGIDEFTRDFAVFEWVTREFQEDLRKGAKRQVPKINNIEKLRQWAAPMLKRRRSEEPMVAGHFHVPTPTIRTHEIEWDDAHLRHYLTVADEFATWYREEKRRAGHDGRTINLVSLLARIGAVERACNVPQFVSEKTLGAPYAPLTSKQRVIIARLCELATQGHKAMCYVDGPVLATLLARHVEAAGHECVLLHGQLPIVERTRTLNERFRYGPAPVSIASKSVTQTGLNLWQADRVLFAVRGWTDTEERQCIARLLRPQQRREVEVEFYNLRGSIDEYQAQMTHMKGDAAGAAVDFLTPQASDDEFIHMDRILDAFVKQIAERAGMKPHDLRQQRKAG